MLTVEYRTAAGEVRGVNRHARRKIEACLIEGWCVSLKWNGLYDYKENDSRYNDDDRYTAVHWMNLRRPKVIFSPSTSKEKIILKFPKTPKPPPDPNPREWSPAVYSDNEADSDSE